MLVLKGTYPKRLLNKKLYLAAGIAAAFECKTTLRAPHITKAVENCTKIKGLYPNRIGTPYKELHSPLVYGLLAHSHVWKGGKAAPAQNVEQRLQEADALHVSHPRLQLDMLCVADLAAWISSTMVFLGPRQVPDWSALEPICGRDGSAGSSYNAYTRTHEQQVQHFTPIGVLVSHLTRKLAREDASLRDPADYYRSVKIAGFGTGPMRMWPSSIYSEGIRPRVEAGLQSGEPWDDWNLCFE